MILIHFQKVNSKQEIRKSQEQNLIDHIKEKFQKSIFKGELLKKIQSTEGRIYDFLQLSNCNYLILNGTTEEIELWSPQLKLITSVKSENVYASFEYKPNHSLIGGSIILLYDTIELKIQSLDVGHSKTITQFLSLSDEKYASSSRDHTVRIWNLKGEKFYVLDSHKNCVFRFIVKDNFLITPGWDSKIKFWNMEKNYELTKEISDSYGAIFQVIELKDGRIAYCSNDSSIKVYKEGTHELLLFYNPVYSILELEDGSILSGGDSKIMKRWKILDGKFLLHSNISTGESTWRIKKMRDGTIGTCQWDGSVKFWI